MTDASPMRYIITLCYYAAAARGFMRGAYRRRCLTVVSAVLASLAAGESALAPVEDAATAPAATVPQRRRKARTQGHEQQGK
jgi:hypothetical protein